jgi:hypothetical protein
MPGTWTRNRGPRPKRGTHKTSSDPLGTPIYWTTHDNPIPTPTTIEQKWRTAGGAIADTTALADNNPTTALNLGGNSSQYAYAEYTYPTPTPIETILIDMAWTAIAPGDGGLGATCDGTIRYWNTLANFWPHGPTRRRIRIPLDTPTTCTTIRIRIDTPAGADGTRIWTLQPHTGGPYTTTRLYYRNGQTYLRDGTPTPIPPDAITTTTLAPDRYGRTRTTLTPDTWHTP